MTVSEVNRYQVVQMFTEDGNKITYSPTGPWVVMASTYESAQSELAALREELAKFDEGMRALACSLGAGGYNAEKLTADQLVGKVQWGIDNIIRVQEQRLTAAESELTNERDRFMKTVDKLATSLKDAAQRNANQVKLLREWDAMWNGGGIHNGPLTKLREATRSALANDTGSFELVPCPSLQRERDMFEEWAAEESEIRGVGETIGLSTDEHHDRYSMIWTQTSWMAWQARAALKPTESGASE